ARTAGKPYALKTEVSRNSLSGRDDLAYVKVTVVDTAGTPVPDASNFVKIKVEGAGSFKAVANGDPTCLESLQKNEMHLFSGSLSFIVEGGDIDGNIAISVSAKGLKTAKTNIINKL
ncbi:MAG: beta-galactosidase, partial [Bacteroidales bacterium]|nr:beta-galactosidase [Candidatus Hennigimonas equi]